MNFFIGFFIGYGVVFLGSFYYKKLLERKEINTLSPQKKPTIIIHGCVTSKAKEEWKKAAKADGWEVEFRG